MEVMDLIDFLGDVIHPILIVFEESYLFSWVRSLAF